MPAVSARTRARQNEARTRRAFSSRTAVVITGVNAGARKHAQRRAAGEAVAGQPVHDIGISTVTESSDIDATAIGSATGSATGNVATGSAIGNVASGSVAAAGSRGVPRGLPVRRAAGPWLLRDAGGGGGGGAGPRAAAPLLRAARDSWLRLRDPLRERQSGRVIVAGAVRHDGNPLGASGGPLPQYPVLQGLRGTPTTLPHSD